MGKQISQSYQYDLCLAFCKNLFTLHLSSPIPCVYRHFGRWRVISNSSPTLHHSSPGLKIDRKMCILLYALMCWSIWVKSCCELFTSAIALFIGIPEGLVKSEEYFRVCFHIIFIGQDYDMTTHLPDFCEPSLRMIWSSCIFLRCLRMALLLMFRVLAISREVIFPLLAIRCKMAFLVSGPPFWTTVRRPAGFAILLAADFKSADLQ